MRITIDCDGDKYIRTVPRGWKVMEPYNKAGDFNYVKKDDRVFDRIYEKFLPGDDVVDCYVGSCFKVIRRIHRKK